ncbi:efflux RND transporter permease subunit [Parachryseolinea silvisoli]|uniref:efflux RND transporter permease subunit n=1 Tax=Parachryseolinea silvisoli TaxID=2873601 RepID=UPI00226597A8|nr:efflux RND transporter permease subunit [Parachryseolinea silvisoli]MCD9019011.1 efflux RND transporter permease subunit [Parachryseolinea silvisoli]
MQDLEKEFKPTSWSIDNKVSIYIATVFICLGGIVTYLFLPKEQFPEVVFPQIYVATVHPGAPSDIENLVTKQLEKQMKSISGVKKMTSNSLQNFSNIIVEFETDVSLDKAKQDVKDAVDRAERDLPNLEDDPEVIDIDISEVPIMNVNIAGDFDLETLREYAEDMQDRIESVGQIRRVDIIGAPEREIQINVDMYRLALAGVTFDDIRNAIAGENVILAGGELSMDGVKRSLTVNGEYASADGIANTVITSIRGGQIYLKDIAEVVDTNKEQESFARLAGKNVITLNVIKRGGENLIAASDQITEIVKDFETNILPPGTDVTITADQSETTRMTLHDLINTIIIGFVLVTLILMFFMGVTNAIFVGLSVPISSFIAFLVMPTLGFTLNMMTLFSFLLALGIVVDDAIVVIENTHRIFDNGKVPIKKAAKIAAGEVFLPVFTGTMVVLAPFVPLMFWPGVIGSFMFYLPVTLIIALVASLLVAYIMNPVFAVDFMGEHEHDHSGSKFTRGFKITSIVMGAIALVSYITGIIGLGNFTVFMYLVYCLYHFLLVRVISSFQTNAWPGVQSWYKARITWLLHGKRPWWVVGFVIFLFFFSFWFTGVRNPPVVFFPKGDPNFIYAYVRMPIGTHQVVTDSVTRVVEERITKVVAADTALVKSIISNVAVGAAEDPFANGSAAVPHLGKVTVAFVEFAKRDSRSTRDYLQKIRDAVKGIKGAEISVDQESGGPPTGKPVNIEFSADDFDALIETSTKAKRYLEELQIPGVEELKSDFQADKPEITIKIDREKANREGISSAVIGQALYTAIHGLEVSKFRDENDDYPIELRVRRSQRNDVNALMNLPITFRDMARGGVVREIPLSAVATAEYTNSYAGIKRIDQKRVISISSNVLSGYNANEIVAQIQTALADFPKADGVEIRMTGEQEDQAETGTFLVIALCVALGLIFMILVLQFNSAGKPLIIMSEIFLSIIGVLLGFSIFRMEISIVMTGVGVLALAGIVVRNGILLVEFTDLLIAQGMETKAAVIEAAQTRMTPVLLTAMAATLGLIPLAVGFNIDFVTMFTELNPHIFFGGDNVAFWGPLSWTMIFGLIFGTFLTLIFVPVLYLLTAPKKVHVADAHHKHAHEEGHGTEPLPTI